MFDLLFDNTPEIEGMSLEIIALLSSNKDIYQISKQRDLLEKLQLFQSMHEPLVITSLYQCYLVVILYESASCLNEQFISFLANDITLCNECSFVYISQIVDLIIEQSPGLVTNALIESLALISQRAMIKIQFYSISNLLHCMTTTDEATCHLLYEKIHESIVSGLSAAEEQNSLTSLLNYILTIVTNFPSMKELFTCNDDFISFIEDMSDFDGELGEISERLIEQFQS